MKLIFVLESEVRALIDQCSFPAVWKNQQLEYQHCNDFYAHFFGYSTVQELLGKTDQQLPCNRFADFYDYCDQYVMENQLSWCGVELAENIHHELIPIYTRKIPVINQGMTVGVFAWFQVINDYADSLFCKNQRLSPRFEFCEGGYQYLTRRELQCLFYLAKGYSAKKIAKKFNISPRTVETHVNNLKDKFSVSSKSDLIAACFERNIFSLLPLPILDENLDSILSAGES